jgi:hypothetical protein
LDDKTDDQPTVHTNYSTEQERLLRRAEKQAMGIVLLSSFISRPE